jgi:hypothetical protein
MSNKNIVVELFNMGKMPENWDVDGGTIESECDELDRSDKEFLETYPVELMSERIHKRLEEETKEESNVVEADFRSRIFYSVTAAAMLAIGLFFSQVIVPGNRFSPNEITRIKGVDESELRVYREAKYELEELDSGTAAREFDRLQISYQVTGDYYGVIFSIDGRGVITRHMAEAGGEAVHLSTQGEEFLPFSYELDDAPDFETFYLLLSDKPFLVDIVLDRAAKEGRSKEKLLYFPRLLRDRSLTQYAVQIGKED